MSKKRRQGREHDRFDHQVKVARKRQVQQAREDDLEDDMYDLEEDQHKEERFQ